MPVYEYKCLKCNETFEIFQKFSDSPLTECSSCGGQIKKLITSTSFVLKGSGWYVTDYPSAARKKAAEAGKEKSNAKETASADSSKEKKGDTKTAPVSA